MRLQTELPNARLLWLEEAGHELHAQDWPAIISAVDEHIHAISSQKKQDNPA